MGLLFEIAAAGLFAVQHRQGQRAAGGALGGDLALRAHENSIVRADWHNTDAIFTQSKIPDNIYLPNRIYWPALADPGPFR
jgi:hypothetical protein